MAIPRRIALLMACLTFCGAPAAQQDVPGRANVYVGAGNFKPSDDGVLSRRDGEFSVDLGFGWRWSRHFAGEIGWLYYSQEADTPPALGIRGLGSDRASLNSSGLGGLLKLVQPVGSADFFAGAGMGHYQSKLSASTFNALTFQTRTVSRSDNNWGYQYVAGVDLRASQNATWTFQYRRVVLDADFGPGIGITKTGGWMWQILLRGTFGKCPECRS
ncbi:MAG TPA: outer membrane beta-barrel protein [Burkholderiales bacterium]|nr:outer membrane beta-barrel protein [Burkholderiales bacterium]